jgi:hypothetical protein
MTEQQTAATAQKAERDHHYLEQVLAPLRVCAQYRPKFGRGKGEGLSRDQFQALYQADPFYNWFGLDNPLMYAAHKAAGGMTSVYRQIGIGCERVVRLAMQDSLGLSAEDTEWSYEVTGANRKKRTLRLDGRVPINQVPSAVARARLRDWMGQAASDVGVTKKVLASLTGVVFEVRQGYKSKDSKRQNADIANAATAYINGYLPCAMILSTQIDGDIATRYRAERWAVLTGTVGHNEALTSTYDFMRAIIGYDLQAFFERHRGLLRKEIDSVLRGLLTAEQP